MSRHPSFGVSTLLIANLCACLHPSRTPFYGTYRFTGSEDADLRETPCIHTETGDPEGWFTFFRNMRLGFDFECPRHYETRHRPKSRVQCTPPKTGAYHGR